MNKIMSIRLLSVLTLLLALSVSCNRNDGNVREPVTVKVRQVTFSDQGRTCLYVGRIEASKTTLLLAPHPGTLAQLFVRAGQRVSRGDTLAVITSGSVQSLYDGAKATYEQARDALERVNKVYATGSVSELRLVDVQTAYAKAEAAYRAAAAALDDCCITAPYGGVVGSVFPEVGVKVGIDEPLFKFMDIDALEVTASIPEKEYSLYPVGKVAMVEVGAVNLRFDAVLTEKGFEASPTSHSYEFVFRLSGNGGGTVMPGMVCKVSMTSSAVPTAVIPSTAVRVDDEGRYVWCIEAGAVVKKHIVTGGFAADGVVVEQGLSEGDLLVTEGMRKISSGMKNIKIEQE